MSVYRRVKKIRYHRGRVRRQVFSRFRKQFLDSEYPGDPKAARLFGKDLKKLSANFSKLFFFQYSLWSRYKFHRHIYRSVILKGARENTLRDVGKASKEGVLFYFPNHQAHIDSMVISWVAKLLRVPQPMFIAWNTLARRRSSYLMPLVNSCLLDRQIMDTRFSPPDPFRNTRNYRAGYTRLFNEYLKHMLSEGVDSLIYPEGGRTYSGKTGEARIRRVFKSALQAQDSMKDRREIFIVPVSLTYTLVPEASQLIRACHEGTYLPPSSLFHDMQHGDDRYAAFRPGYETRSGFPLIREFLEKKTPIYCVLGDPISLRENAPTLEQCFEPVKQNLKVLPHHFVARLILSGKTAGMIDAARQLRNTIPEHLLDEAFFDELGLRDILSVGLDFFRCEGAVSETGEIRDPLLLEYYGNKCIPNS